jgi:Gly-Xaa carboxypeptidase
LPVFDGEIVWGRGASDTKNSLIGSLAAVEHLLEQGWSPRRTVVFAFGFTEEIGGPLGAASIGPLLLERYGEVISALLSFRVL